MSIQVRIERGIRYSHHTGECREAGTAPGEVAACISFGSPYRVATHVVGALEDVLAYVEAMARPAFDERAVVSALNWLRAGAPGDSVWIRAHLCDCRRRAADALAAVVSTPPATSGRTRR